MSSNEYTQEDCIEAVIRASEILGESPSGFQYQSLDISPCYQTIYNVVGSWNKAKELAGLKKNESGIDIQLDIPEILDIEKEEWENATSDKRQYLVKKCKLAEVKLQSGCKRCSYDKHPDALDFHHKQKKEKEFSVSVGYLRESKSWEIVKSEMEKCIVLCSNCHRVENSYDFNVM